MFVGWGHDGRLESYQEFRFIFSKVGVSTACLERRLCGAEGIGRLPSLGVGSRYGVVGSWTKVALPWGLCVGVGWRSWGRAYPDASFVGVGLKFWGWGLGGYGYIHELGLLRGQDHFGRSGSHQGVAVVLGV